MVHAAQAPGSSHFHSRPHRGLHSLQMAAYAPLERRFGCKKLLQYSLLAGAGCVVVYPELTWWVLLALATDRHCCSHSQFLSVLPWLRLQSRGRRLVNVSRVLGRPSLP